MRIGGIIFNKGFNVDLYVYYMKIETHGLKGVHATTKSRLAEIRRNGFEIGVGERGAGIYFWKSSPFQEDLAVGWYETRLEPHDSCKVCGVVYSRFEVGADEYINLDENYLKEGLLCFCKTNNFENKRLAAGKIYDEFLERLEKDLGLDLKLVEVQVVPPKKSNYPTQIAGMASCLVARNSECIIIEASETVEKKDFETWKQAKELERQRSGL